MNGKLTAEQVRELIAPHLGARPTFDFGHHGAVWRVDFQAIADELNATLGGGECEVEYSHAWMGWHCKSCDTLWMGIDSQKPSYCMRCGRRVKGGEE